MFKKSIPIIFIGLSMAVAVLVLGWVVFVKLKIPIPVPVVSDENNETADWLVYENNEIGIKFKYPKNLGETKTYKISSKDKDAPSYLEGEKISIRFDKSDFIYISSFTSDYKGFIDFGSFTGNSDIESECKNPLKYSHRGDVCKVVEIDGEKAIWKNYFSEIECSSSFGTKIYFNNKKSSVYKGLSILFYLDDASSELHKLYNNCADEKGNKKAYSKAVTISKNIMEGKNLSNEDQRKLDIINKIILNFEFIK